jgi:Family of unknown function (DUF5955)
MTNWRNDGIVVTGNVSGQVVNKPQGPVTQHVTTTDDARMADLTARLEDLDRLLTEHREQVQAYDGAKRDLADIRHEVARPDKDTDRISDTLRRLATRVGSLVSRAAAAEKLAEAVRAFF